MDAVGVLGTVLLASMLMLLCSTIRDLAAIVVSREDEADDGISEVLPGGGLRAVLAGVEGAEVTTGTSGLDGSSLVKVPWRIRSGSGEGATFAFAPPMVPSDGCLSRIFGMSAPLAFVTLAAEPAPPPFSSNEFRFDPRLDRALNGCGLARATGSTSELCVRNLGVANGFTGTVVVAVGAATGVRAMTAGADFR